jgi:protein-disulfide isomerase
MMNNQSIQPDAGPNRRALIAVIVLAVLGLALSAELLRIHLTVVTNPFHPFACRVSETVDCNAVALSAQAVLLGVPVPIWGLLTYLVFGALGLIALRGRRLPWSHAADFILLLALWSVGYSAYLAAVAVWVIKKFCLYCVGLYIVNIGLFLAGMFAARPLSQFISRRREDLKWLIASPAASVTAGVAAMLAFLLVIGLHYWSHQTRLYAVGPNTQFDISHNAVQGNPRALVTIIEFSDFECPACREMQPTVKSLLKKYPDTVRLISKSFPLDSTCNSEISKPIHPDACLAASAAHCALRMGKFEEINDALWTATDLSRPALLKIAQAHGLNPDEFSLCLDGPEAKEAILIDLADSKKIKLEATPTFIVNGHQFEGKQTLQWCSRLIDKILRGEPISSGQLLNNGSP